MLHRPVKYNNWIKKFEYSNVRFLFYQTLTGIGKMFVSVAPMFPPFLLHNPKHAPQSMDLRCIACQNNSNTCSTTFPVASLPFPPSITSLLSFHSLPCVALRCVALRCLALPCVALPCLALPCFALPFLALPCFALPCFALPCLALPCFALPCLALPCLALPGLAFGCLWLPCLALPLLALP